MSVLCSDHWRTRRSWRRDANRIASLTALLLGLASERTAFAQVSPASSARAPVASVSAPEPASLWRPNWPEFSTTEAILTLTAAVGTGAIVLVGPTHHPRWRGGILFDDAVRDDLRAKDPQTRSHFRTIGNYTYRLSPLVPLLDALLVSAVVHRDRKLAVNLALITLEAFSYSGLAAFATTETAARARPDSECHDSHCTADTQSFFSGHATISATSAGLVCANHSRIALYGNGFADAAICGLMAINALTTATTRVVADRHYASDVIVGTGVGFGIGYAVPVLLHYSRAGRSVAVGPDPSCGGNCISVSGSF
jgi:membrane-associated phospholipid phosphatase